MKRFLALSVFALTLGACSDAQKTDGKVSEVIGVSVSEDKGVIKVTSTVDKNGSKIKAEFVLTNYGVRTPLGQNPNTGAYVTVENTGKTDDRLISAFCECAARTELHTMSMADGQMSMSAVPEGFEIKAGETLVLAPGGNHIMLFDLTTRPAEGATQKVTLVFEKAGEITIDMPVSMTPAAPAAH
jgi:periplasmic copper chaperone A